MSSSKNISFKTTKDNPKALYRNWQSSKSWHPPKVWKNKNQSSNLLIKTHQENELKLKFYTSTQCQIYPKFRNRTKPVKTKKPNWKLRTEELKEQLTQTRKRQKKQGSDNYYFCHWNSQVGSAGGVAESQPHDQEVSHDAQKQGRWTQRERERGRESQFSAGENKGWLKQKGKVLLQCRFSQSVLAVYLLKAQAFQPNNRKTQSCFKEMIYS